MTLKDLLDLEVELELLAETHANEFRRISKLVDYHKHYEQSTYFGSMSEHIMHLLLLTGNAYCAEEIATVIGSEVGRVVDRLNSMVSNGRLRRENNLFVPIRSSEITHEH